ncbi:MAG: NAD(P)-dependent oxidoreductase, partial [Candidatus Omnitrophica bacterium]|nr:NAD(P)-dependent oxidoreductase [Candidatus Omnitrophota bacterium]
MLIVGIPKEIKPFEKRVGLTPEAVGRLASQSIKVLIEQHAGLLSGYPNQDYEKQGAVIVRGADELYRNADLIIKIKEPLAPEWPLLRKGQVLFSFLHLASQEHGPLVHQLCASGVTALAYETVEVEGQIPILAPMSAIAGALAAAYAALFRTLNIGHAVRIVYPRNFILMMEKVAEDYPQAPKQLKLENVVVFGGGTAGTRAAEFALEMNGRVTIVEKNPERRNRLQEKFSGAKNRPLVLAAEELTPMILADADVLIGCVHQAGCRAAIVVEAESLKTASAGKKKLILDVSIDQGGNFNDAHATFYADPLYLDSFGNLRFAVANMPSFCGRYASDAIAKVTLPYIEALAGGIPQALRKFPELKGAINIRDGIVASE